MDALETVKYSYAKWEYSVFILYISPSSLYLKLTSNPGRRGTRNTREERTITSGIRRQARFIAILMSWIPDSLALIPVIETHNTNPGPDHSDTLLSMASLASTYWNKGRWEDAEGLEIQVTEMSQTKLGADHPDTLTSINNLAYTWKSLHFDDKAMDLIRQWYRARQRVLGPNHPQTLSTVDIIKEWCTSDDPML